MMNLRHLAAAIVAATLPFGAAHAATATVTDFTVGSGGGVNPLGTVTTASNIESAINTLGDGSYFAFGTGGSLTLSLDMAVSDGVGDDISFFDSTGLSEGLSVEASSDGLSFVFIGSDPGDFGTGCSSSSPCETGFDLSVGGLATASFFRLTAIPNIVSNFPEAYDLDGFSILNSEMSSVPLPAGLPLVIAGLGAFGMMRRRKQLPDAG